MTGDRPAVALLGCGHWGQNLARNLANLGVLRIVCDANQGALDRVQKTFPEVQTTTTAKDVFDDPTITACVIATPAASHAALACEALEAGKDAIAKEVRRGGLPLQRLMNAESMSTIAHELRYVDVSALYTAVGESHVSAQHVVQRLVAHLGGVGDVEEELAERATPSTIPTRPRQVGDAGVLVSGTEGVVAKLAKCCTPVPGDDILGFVTRGGSVSVHRTDCTNAKSLGEQSERFIDVEWAPSASSVFLVAIQIEALDRHRLLSDVTKALADEKVNILSASVATSGDRVAISKFTFEMGDPKHLGHVLNVVRNVEGVYDVYRLTSAA